ncbi:CopG family transcriptional regulator [Cohnella suwonensis]|uniref:CopG family transcriptional regulator n=1 Tax=Cohnella suwonensis TaxID=696072 RepID=A0ABW0M278_9BACL
MKTEKIKLGVPDKEGQLSIMFSKGGPRKGAGRKGFGVTKKLSLTLSEELWETFERRANSLHISKSEMVREIMEAFFLTESGNKDVTSIAD